MPSRAIPLISLLMVLTLAVAMPGAADPVSHLSPPSLDGSRQAGDQFERRATERRIRTYEGDS